MPRTQIPILVDIGAGLYYPRGQRSKYVLNDPPVDLADESDALLWLRILGARASITAFEPKPDKALELLEAALSRPGTRNNSLHLTVHPGAVGNREGRLLFANCHTGETGWQLVGNRSLAQLRAERCSVEYTVPVTTLDAWAAYALPEGGRVFYLKVDTEGGEIDVLNGMGKLLRQQRVELMSFEWKAQIMSRLAHGGLHVADDLGGVGLDDVPLLAGDRVRREERRNEPDR